MYFWNMDGSKRRLLLSEKILLIKFIYHIVDFNKQHTVAISCPGPAGTLTGDYWSSSRLSK